MRSLVKAYEVIIMNQADLKKKTYFFCAFF